MNNLLKLGGSSIKYLTTELFICIAEVHVELKKSVLASRIEIFSQINLEISK